MKNRNRSARRRTKPVAIVNSCWPSPNAAALIRRLSHEASNLQFVESLWNDVQTGFPTKDGETLTRIKRVEMLLSEAVCGLFEVMNWACVAKGDERVAIDHLGDHMGGTPALALKEAAVLTSFIGDAFGDDNPGTQLDLMDAVSADGRKLRNGDTILHAKAAEPNTTGTIVAVAGKAILFRAHRDGSSTDYRHAEAGECVLLATFDRKPRPIADAQAA